MTDYPKVSVVTITYMHEDYIVQTLDGVLIQDYPGEIEFIIANDNSQDATDHVIQEYLAVQNIPTNFTIKYTRHEKNKGMIPNFIWALEQASGKYIALCEGDDYWTDPLKLQKQVDFLEGNGRYVIHSGKAQILRATELMGIIGDPLAKNTYDITDFYTRNNFITCTVMFRNMSISPRPFDGLLFGDWLLYVLLFSKKRDSWAYVTDELYAVYRIHSGGAMQKVGKQFENAQAHLKQIECVHSHSIGKFTELDISKINNYSIIIFEHHLRSNRYRECFKIILRNVFLVKTDLPLRNYLGLINYHKFYKNHA